MIRQLQEALRFVLSGGLCRARSWRFLLFGCRLSRTRYGLCASDLQRGSGCIVGYWMSASRGGHRWLWHRLRSGGGQGVSAGVAAIRNRTCSTHNAALGRRSVSPILHASAPMARPVSAIGIYRSFRWRCDPTASTDIGCSLARLLSPGLPPTTLGVPGSRRKRPSGSRHLDVRRPAPCFAGSARRAPAAEPPRVEPHAIEIHLIYFCPSQAAVRFSRCPHGSTVAVMFIRFDPK